MKMRPLFSARAAFRISKISSCLRMPGGAGHVQPFGDRRQRADAHVLERRPTLAFRAGGVRRGRPVAFGGGLLGGRGGRLPR